MEDPDHFNVDVGYQDPCDWHDYAADRREKLADDAEEARATPRAPDPPKGYGRPSSS